MTKPVWGYIMEAENSQGGCAVCDVKQQWLRAIGEPEEAIPAAPLTLLAYYEYPDFDAELYSQPNSKGTSQRVMMAFPKNADKPCPAVAVPFYFAEAMLGFDPATGEAFPRYGLYPMMADLARRGYVTASADAYHLTYIKSDRARDDFHRWADAADALRRDHPNWTGIGKLISDTRLVIDALAADPRVDAGRIGIAGHSLGGKMAFYTGCLDERIRVILASDFGIGWDQTNWRDTWYWADKVEQLIARGMDHAQLLGLAAPKPFCLIAGQYDNMDSWDMMCRAPGYASGDGRLKIINHATGHTPPPEALREGYDFLDRWLK